MPTTPFHIHGDSSQAQGCEVGIEVTGPHRQVARLDRIVEGENLSSWHLNQPAGRAYPPRADRVISTVGNKTVEVLNVISDGVGTRRPDRQLNDDARRFRTASLADPKGLTSRLTKIKIEPDNRT